MHFGYGLKPLVLGCLFCAGRRLVNTHGGGINELNFLIHIALHIQGGPQFGKHPVPHTCLAPALKAAVDRFPIDISFQHISPSCTSSYYPKHAIHIDDLAMGRPGYVLLAGATLLFARMVHWLRRHCFAYQPVTAISNFACRP